MKRGELKRKTPLSAKKPLKLGKGFNNRKSPRQRAIARADKLIQQVAIARDKGWCQKCKEKGEYVVASAAHHIVHRQYYSLRWKLDNLVSVCYDCHTMDGTIRKPVLTNFCIRWTGGRDAMDALRLRAHTDPSEEPEDAITRLQGLDNG